MKKLFLTVVGAMCLILLSRPTLQAQETRYPSLMTGQVVVQGDSGKWDADKVHTLSVAEANRDGYKYWGYYGLAYYGGDPALRKAGLVRSNDLVHWDKYNGNPIIESNCRWPTVVLVKSTFYMFYAEYNAANDSRIVMLASKDGIHFGDKTVVVPEEVGMQNQNPFIYFDKRDNKFCLLYYHGIERSIDSTSNYWSIMLKESKSIDGLGDANPMMLLLARNTLAAPSIAFFKDRYYLLAEARKIEGTGANEYKWVTVAYASKRIDGHYAEVVNSPVLYDNDACAFEYVFGGHLYIFYSHCLNLAKWNWELKMVEAVK